MHFAQFWGLGGWSEHFSRTVNILKVVGEDAPLSLRFLPATRLMAAPSCCQSPSSPAPLWVKHLEPTLIYNDLSKLHKPKYDLIHN